MYKMFQIYERSSKFMKNNVGLCGFEKCDGAASSEIWIRKV